MTISFISTSLVLKIHQQQLERFGGSEGIRDLGLLDSALGAARHTWSYTESIYDTAAQYCYSIANNHPFLDGNKRTAAACMLVFLVKNGVNLRIDNNLLYDLVIDASTNAMGRAGLAEILRQHARLSN